VGPEKWQEDIRIPSPMIVTSKPASKGSRGKSENRRDEDREGERKRRCEMKSRKSSKFSSGNCVFSFLLRHDPLLFGVFAELQQRMEAKRRIGCLRSKKRSQNVSR